MKNKALADIAIVIAISLAAFALEVVLAPRLPWGEEARGALAVLGGTLAALWLTLGRGGSLADLGFRRPRRWLTAPLWALGILVVFIVAQGFVQVMLAQAFDVPQPDLSRYDVIRGNLRAAIFYATLLPLVAAIPEEILYRGFLVDRFSKVFGGSGNAFWLAAIAQAVLFGLVHFQWGIGGILMTTIMGLVWGFAYVLCGRNLWIVIIAHSAAHVALVTQLYFTPVGA